MFRIIIEEQAVFIETEKISIERDIVPAHIDDWAKIFRKLLLVKGFHPKTVSELLGEPE